MEGRGRRNTELLRGKMSDTSRSEIISTRQWKIAELARQAPEMSFTSLNHHLDMDWLREAYRRTRKDGAVGVDGQTAADLQSIWRRTSRTCWTGPSLDAIGRLRCGG